MTKKQVEVTIDNFQIGVAIRNAIRGHIRERILDAGLPLDEAGPGEHFALDIAGLIQGIMVGVGATLSELLEGHSEEARTAAASALFEGAMKAAFGVATFDASEFTPEQLAEAEAEVAAYEAAKAREAH